MFSLAQVGLYRVSGQERMVKELKEKLIRGKTLPPLNKVDDINVITGVLKDFLRNLPEPLLTFHLNKAFIEAAGEFPRLVESLTEVCCNRSGLYLSECLRNIIIWRTVIFNWVNQEAPWETGNMHVHECEKTGVNVFVEIQDDGNSLAMLYQTISELPQPNRDTLACLMIHLQK